MRKKIFVLDDDLEDLEIIKKALASFKDLEVSYFSDSYDLIRFINATQAPSLIISDYNMPSIDGFNVLSYLQRSKKFSEVPIVILTGSISEAGKARLLRAGARKVYPKPVGEKGFIRIIEEIKHTIYMVEQVKAPERTMSL